MNLDRLAAKILSTALVVSLFSPTSAFSNTQSNTDTLRRGATVEQPAAEAGLEEALTKLDTNGSYKPLLPTDPYEAIGVNGIRFTRAVVVTDPTRITGKFGTVTVDPTKEGEYPGQTTVIAAGARLLDGTRVEGPAVIQAAIVGGYIGGTPEKPTVIGDGAEIKGLQSDVRRVVVGPGVVVARAPNVSDTVIVSLAGQSASIGTGTIAEEGTAILGGTVGTNVKFRRNSVIGPFVAVGNNSEFKAILLVGASDEAGVEFPHEGYMGSFWAVPIQIPENEAQPYTPEYYARVRQILRAILFGSIVSDKAMEKGPISSTGAVREITAQVPGDANPVTFLAQRINFGANTITSDYNPLTGAKTGGVAEGGVATGVDSVLKGPIFLKSAALVGNLSQADGEVTIGTLVAGSIQGGKIELKGYRAPGTGFVLGDGLAAEVRAQMDFFERLGVTADVLAEGARTATDPYTLAGYQAALRAVSEQFNELGKRYGNVLGKALEISLGTLQARHQAESDASRRDRLQNRIIEQQKVQSESQAVLDRLKEISDGIAAAKRSVVDPVSQKMIADDVRQKITDPETPWVNPLIRILGITDTRLPGLVRYRTQSIFRPGVSAPAPTAVAVVPQGKLVIHADASVVEEVRRWVAAANPAYFSADAIEVREGFEGFRAGAIGVIGNATQAPTIPDGAHLVNLEAARGQGIVIESLDVLIQQWLTLAGHAVQRVLGAITNGTETFIFV